MKICWVDLVWRRAPTTCGSSRSEQRLPADAVADHVALELHQYGASFRRLFYEQFFPDADAQLLDEIDQIMVKRFNGEVAAAYAAGVFNSDFSDEASRLQLPVLVLHSRHDRFCAFSEGRHLASLIPNAGFIAVESNHNVPLATDADWPASILAIERFLDRQADRE